MKKNYQKPMIEFEEYELNTAIATGCQSVVSLGPGDEAHEICDDYEVDLGPATFSLNPGDHENPSSSNFYQKSCSCYLSAGEGTMFTS